MTVIAYRDGVLAADRFAVAGGVIWCHKTKIVRRAGDGALIGTAGSGPIGERYKAWFLAGGDALRRPSLSQMLDGEAHSAGALVVRADGTVEEHCDLAVEIREGAFHAIGCGAVFALAAMEMGASAARAVEVACRFDVHCGGGVDTLRLEEGRRIAAE